MKKYIIIDTNDAQVIDDKVYFRMVGESDTLKQAVSMSMRIGLLTEVYKRVDWQVVENK